MSGGLAESMRVVVDSSVAVKWFAPGSEAGVDAALALLEAHREEALELAAPTLMRLEVLNALWAARWAARLTEDQLRTAARDLEGFRLAWFEIEAALAAEAAAVATRFGLTVYDSVFAALAIRLDAELVTADRVLATSLTASPTAPPATRSAASEACRVRLIG